MKLFVKLMQTAGLVKLATGLAQTVIVLDVESTHPLSERTISFVENAPSVLNICFSVSLLFDVLPLKRFHVHDAMFVRFMVDLLAKSTSTSTQVLLVVKFGVGNGLTTMVLVIVSRQP